MKTTIKKTTTTTKIETCHFQSRHAAGRYYKEQGHDLESVNQKIKDKEIVIGHPKVGPNESCTVNNEGRFVINTPDLMAVHIKPDAASSYPKRILKHRSPQGYGLSPEERKFSEMLKVVEDTWLEVETKFLFNNQYNTTPIPDVSKNGLRIHDQDIDEIRNDVRNDFVGCGYCANQQLKSKQVFCDKCLDSEYLELNNLPLTRLKPILTPHKDFFTDLTEEELAERKPLFIERQTKGDSSRNAAKLTKQREDIKKKHQRETEAAQTEHDGMLWLMDHNINISNVIYYDHTDIFGFGWRHSMKDVADNLHKLLDKDGDSFPHNYEIK